MVLLVTALNVTAIISSVEASPCESGWTFHAGHCYRRITPGANYDSAQAVCEGFGGYIAVPNTESENNFLSSTMNPSSTGLTWGGFDYTNNELWEDGTSSGSTDGWRVLYGVSDSGDRGNGEPVVFMRPNGAWSFEGKGFVYEYVCENPLAVGDLGDLSVLEVSTSDATLDAVHMIA